MSEDNKEENFEPYCPVCTGCGEEGCCSPLSCSMDEKGSYCQTYLRDLRFGYRMHQDLLNLLKDDEKYKEEIDKLFDKNYDLEYPTNEDR